MSIICAGNHKTTTSTAGGQHIAQLLQLLLYFKVDVTKKLKTCSGKVWGMLLDLQISMNDNFHNGKKGQLG